MWIERPLSTKAEGQHSIMEPCLLRILYFTLSVGLSLPDLPICLLPIQSISWRKSGYKIHMEPTQTLAMECARERPKVSYTFTDIWLDECTFSRKIPVVVVIGLGRSTEKCNQAWSVTVFYLVLFCGSSIDSKTLHLVTIVSTCPQFLAFESDQDTRTLPQFWLCSCKGIPDLDSRTSFYGLLACWEISETFSNSRGWLQIG